MEQEWWDLALIIVLMYCAYILVDTSHSQCAKKENV